MDLELFDSWEPIAKARKPIGLENWKRLSHMAEQLKGKKAADLTFTSCYPGSEGKKKVLGSIDGNLHFLMGYANPAFHLAPYHWCVMDPNLSEEDALVLHKTKGHPSRPELWERCELDMEDEGDLIDGAPHPSVAVVRENVKVARAKKAESITVEAGVGRYTAIPSEGLVYGDHNKQVYAWEMLKDSFFAAANPALAEKMNEYQEAELAMEEEMSRSIDIPLEVRHRAFEFVDVEFDDNVYPLVKSHYPGPSSIVPLNANTGETIYGVVTNNSLDFYDRGGAPANINVYDMSFASFDLTQEGGTFSSVVKSLGDKFLPEGLEEFVHE